MNKKILFSLAEASPVASPKASGGRKHKSSNFAKNIDSFLQNCERATKSRGFLFLILLGVLVFPSLVFAQITIAGMVAGAVDTALLIASGVVVILWVMTGILFLQAQGAPEKLSLAKKALFAATAGTVLVIVAKFAIDLVGQAFRI